MKYLAIDFEGSHKEPRRGCPVQLGVAVMADGEVLASAEWLIKPPRHYKSGKPTREVDAYALAVSGLTLEKIEAEGLDAYEVCCQLNKFVKENEAKSLPILAYSFTYDAECYENLLYEGGDYDFTIKEYVGLPPILGAKWICVRQTARLLLPGQLVHYSLDDVAGLLGFSRTTEAHGALEDAILAGKVYHALVSPKMAVPA